MSSGMFPSPKSSPHFHVMVRNESGAPLYGLVMAGGESRRMGENKALLTYGSDKSQLRVCHDLLAPLCERVWISTRSAFVPDYERSQDHQDLVWITDAFEDLGPAGGILSAMQAHPQAAFLVLAVDLPLVGDADLRQLMAARNTLRQATAFRSVNDDFLEPLCAIYEPSARGPITSALERNVRCMSKILGSLDVHVIAQAPGSRALLNVNHPNERLSVLAQKASPGSKAPTDLRIKVRYFASLRERAGRSEEILEAAPSTPAALYAQLSLQYGFGLRESEIRVAINGDFGEMTQLLRPNDEVVFIPPVAGG